MNRLAIALLSLTLAACSRAKEPAPPSPAVPVATKPSIAATAVAPTPPGVAVASTALGKQREVEWMRALFGAAYDAGKGHALIGGDGEEGAHADLLTLHAATELPDGDVAIIVNSMPGNEQGEQDVNPATEGVLSVYRLRPAGSSWRVVEEYEDLASMGSMGLIGSVTWVSLGNGKPGFVVSSHYFNRGQSITNARVYELGNKVRQLGSLDEQSDNTGACLPDSTDCWDVGGTLRFAEPAAGDGYADLLVDFEGRHYRVEQGADGRETEQVTQGIKQSARYRFNGKSYVLVSGVNPVPAL